METHSLVFEKNIFSTLSAHYIFTHWEFLNKNKQLFLLTTGLCVTQPYMVLQVDSNGNTAIYLHLLRKIWMRRLLLALKGDNAIIGFSMYLPPMPTPTTLFIFVYVLQDKVLSWCECSLTQAGFRCQCPARLQETIWLVWLSLTSYSLLTASLIGPFQSSWYKHPYRHETCHSQPSIFSPPPKQLYS